MICVMGLHTFPYYGLDYLTASGFGYIYQDRALHSFQPRTGYVAPEAVLDKDWEWDFTVDSSSFDDDHSVTEEYVLEYSTFPAEQGWVNRDRIRQRLDGRDRERFRNYLYSFFDPYGYKSSLFQSPELNAEGIPLSAVDMPYLLSQIDALQDAVFVEDDYYGDSDSTSHGDNPYDYETYCRRKFRDNFYGNPIYKTIMHGDMLSFLAGQPQSSNLFPEDEFDLYQRRFILQHYLDSLCQRKRSFFQKDKHSFAHRVYNQQFKGTLSFVRQYDAVRVFFPDLDVKGNRESFPETKELKFDQPLYNRYQNEYQDWLHEELRPNISSRLWKGL